MSLKSRAWAGFGSAALVGMVLAPAANAVSAHPAPEDMKHSMGTSLRNIPAFPGLNASDSMLQAWVQKLTAQYHLPAPPAPNASEAKKQAYIQQLISALHLPPLPGDDASDAQIEAWLNKAAAAIGLPALPGMNASDAAWEAWFTKAFGISPQQMVNQMGAAAQFGNQICVKGVPRMEVAAVNFANTPATIAEIVDSKMTNSVIHLKGSSLEADHPESYEGSLAVPAGKHKVSLVNTTSGKVLDITMTSGVCAAKPAHHHHGTNPAKPGLPMPTHHTGTASTAPHPATPVGPVVQTDYVKTGNNDEALYALAGIALVALTGTGAFAARARRR